jgi:hypothetical protein
MHQRIKKYLSFLFLLLFLFPMVEKGMHELEHKDDFRCSSTNKHFHNLEHNCSICDFTTIDSNNSASHKFELITPTQLFLFHPFVENISVEDAFQYLPARAPPIA